MNILILGDIMGPSGREAIIKKLPNLIKKKKLDFVIVNGENAADPGVGITKKNTKEFFEAGTDVITTGNHVYLPALCDTFEMNKLFLKKLHFSFFY